MKTIHVTKVLSKGSKFMRGIVSHIAFNAVDDVVVTVKYKTIPDRQYRVY